MIGAIAGDIIGSIHEGAGTKTEQFPRSNQRQQRVVNSLSVAPAASTEGPGLSDEELPQFIDCGVASRDKRLLEDR